MTLCNVIGSAMTREADFTVLYTNAGPEIGVASTKAFTTQLVGLYLLAIKLGRLRGTLAKERAEHLENAVARSQAAREVLHTEAKVKAIARRYHKAQRLLVPRPRADASGRPRGRAEAEGDLVHSRRGLRGRRDEARPHRAHRREDAGGGHRSAEPNVHYEKILGNISKRCAHAGQVIAWSSRATRTRLPRQ
jgi:glucosamine--fructose-6-phosphate aminotransferase (isomerizing)